MVQRNMLVWHVDESSMDSNAVRRPFLQHMFMLAKEGNDNIPTTNSLVVDKSVEKRQMGVYIVWCRALCSSMYWITFFLLSRSKRVTFWVEADTLEKRFHNMLKESRAFLRM